MMDQSLISSPQPSFPNPAPLSASEDNLSDDDIDFEPATEESDELEYFETVDGENEVEDDEGDETEGEIHGESSLQPFWRNRLSRVSCLLFKLQSKTEMEKKSNSSSLYSLVRTPTAKRMLQMWELRSLWAPPGLYKVEDTAQPGKSAYWTDQRKSNTRPDITSPGSLWSSKAFGAARNHQCLFTR